MKKPRPTYRELFKRYYENSTCEVFHSTFEKAVNIVFTGELVRIPSLKNLKIPGKNFIAPDTKARLKAMDAHFQRAIERKGYKISTISLPMLLVFVAGRRSRSFDLSGCVETVQDWLEPETKRVGRKSKSRGWGVGLIDNDSQIRPIAFHHHDLKGFPDNESRIMLIPLLEVCDHSFLNYIGRLKV